jgi:hypothetical protein
MSNDHARQQFIANVCSKSEKMVGHVDYPKLRYFCSEAKLKSLISTLSTLLAQLAYPTAPMEEYERATRIVSAMIFLLDKTAGSAHDLALSGKEDRELADQCIKGQQSRS